MILTDTFWPLLAISSFFTGNAADSQSAMMTSKHKHGHGHEHGHHKGHHGHEREIFPGHTIYKLNDGSYIPSPAWGTGTGTVVRGDAATDVLRALDNGWRHIDTSRNYRNQKGTGEAIAKSGIPREEIYVTTKYDAIGGADVATELAFTLNELNLTYIDSYLIHAPSVAVKGGGIAKVWAALENAVEQGLVRTIGVSNYDTVELLEGLYDVVDKVKPTVNQIDYSVYNAIDVSPAIAYGSMRGLLFSAYGELRPITRSPGGPADAVGAGIAKRLSKDTGKEVTYAQVILDWLKSTGVLAVTTTSNEGRLKEQLVPFGNEFPLLTAAEVRAFELSGLGYKG